MRLLEEQLEELQSVDQGEQERKEQGRRLQLKRLEGERKAVEEQIELEGAAREEAEARMKEDGETEVRIKAEVKAKKERKAALRREVEEMEGAQGQHLAVFGAKIPLVEAALQRNKARSAALASLP